MYSQLKDMDEEFYSIDYHSIDELEASWLPQIESYLSPNIYVEFINSYRQSVNYPNFVHDADLGNVGLRQFFIWKVFWYTISKYLHGEHDQSSVLYELLDINNKYNEYQSDDNEQVLKIFKNYFTPYAFELFEDVFKKRNQYVSPVASFNDYEVPFLVVCSHLLTNHPITDIYPIYCD